MTRLGVISLHRFRLRTVKSTHDSVDLRLICGSYKIDMNKTGLLQGGIYGENWGSKQYGLDVGPTFILITNNEGYYKYDYPAALITIKTRSAYLVVKTEFFNDCTFLNMVYAGKYIYRILEHIINGDRVCIEELTTDYVPIRMIPTAQTFISMSVFEWTKFFLSLPYIAI